MLQRHENSIQTLRLNEARYRSRVEELEKQIDFYKSQLLLTKEECDSLTKRLSRESSPQTAATPDGRRRYQSFPPRPEDGARVEVGSTASSELSSLSASERSGSEGAAAAPSVKENKLEEKEKESSEEDNEKQVSKIPGEKQGRDRAHGRETHDVNT